MEIVAIYLCFVVWAWQLQSAEIPFAVSWGA
jgi:hypothetical protein